MFEYNYSYLLVLKNVIDFFNWEWWCKLLVYVSYGGVLVGICGVVVFDQGINGFGLVKVGVNFELNFLKIFFVDDVFILGEKEEVIIVKQFVELIDFFEVFKFLWFIG